MSIYLRTRENISSFQRLTSLTPSEFDDVLPRFEAALRRLQEKEESARLKPRKNKPGQGDKPKLATPAEKFFFMLHYYCVYPLQISQGVLFDLSESQTCRTIHRLSSVMTDTFSLTAPTRDAATLRAKLIQLQAAGIDPVAALDGTERPVLRPSDNARQSDLYSGRHKQHAYKNLILSMSSVVIFLSGTVTARIHDVRVARESEFQFPDGWMVLQDTGFQGLDLSENVTVAMPIKKKKGKDLSALQKSFNRAISSHRVSVEHAIGGCKRARIVKDIYRNRKEGFHDHVMMLAASLHNHRRTCRSKFAKSLFPNEIFNL